MVRITEDLIRKRAEHNECVIATLEEISLHQQDLEKIEYLDKWCRDLKILYLQSNLIPRIENVGRLKKMEYLNLALNNVELIENLEGCESLKKLDLTINFVGELTSVESLRDLVHFRDLYLTGNPCTEYEGYRDYVIATLPQLKYLDGVEIEKSERILAVQKLAQTRAGIIEQQQLYSKKREKQKAECGVKEKEENQPGYDGTWYTDINTEDGKTTEEKEEKPTEEEVKKTEEDEDKKFWDEKVPFTPESRIAVHEQLKKQRERDEKKGETDVLKKERKLVTDDGRILNVNEPKIDFTLTEDDESNSVLLDLAVYKHLDSSLVDVDVQPTHVKVLLKGKIIQLVLPEEVRPDSSTAKRSQITGHLLITMPKASPVIKPVVAEKQQQQTENKTNSNKQEGTGHERLEVDPSSSKSVDIANIVRDKDSAPSVPLLGARPLAARKVEERANSADFVDDEDVPPLM